MVAGAGALRALAVAQAGAGLGLAALAGVVLAQAPHKVVLNDPASFWFPLAGFAAGAALFVNGCGGACCGAHPARGCYFDAFAFFTLLFLAGEGFLWTLFVTAPQVLDALAAKDATGSLAEALAWTKANPAATDAILGTGAAVLGLGFFASWALRCCCGRDGLDSDEEDYYTTPPRAPGFGGGGPNFRFRRFDPSLDTPARSDRAAAAVKYKYTRPGGDAREPLLDAPSAPTFSGRAFNNTGYSAV